ncbi:protoporphyrinogen oxidase HemJ [Fretibacter rubidus]|uniref:protoporphyrinogen oxidase HemJ n=1 Tax=Fretibacter rubidus TaxID=570162 RepID=UPI00352A23C8
MFDLYLWVKAAHLCAVIFWMAGLLYLPRLYVYHSASKPGGELEAKMIEAAEKLMRIIMNPAMIVAFLLGLVLIGYNIETLKNSAWLWIKLVLVFFLMGYHGFLSKMRKRFKAGQRPKSEKFFRMINEIPAVATIIIVVMAIVKPF